MENNTLRQLITKYYMLKSYSNNEKEIYTITNQILNNLEFIEFINEIIQYFLFTPKMFFNWNKNNLKNKNVSIEFYFNLYCLYQTTIIKNYNDLDFYFACINKDLNTLKIENKERLTNNFLYLNNLVFKELFPYINIQDLRTLLNDLLCECEINQDNNNNFLNFYNINI